MSKEASGRRRRRQPTSPWAPLLAPERVAAADFDRRYGARRSPVCLFRPHRPRGARRSGRAGLRSPGREGVRDLGESTKTVRIANSAGVLAEDVQPLLPARVRDRRPGRRAPGRHLRRRRADRAGVLPVEAARALRREAARMAVTLLSAREAPAERCRGTGTGLAGILLHEAVGHGLEGDSQPEGHLGLHGPHRPARGRARGDRGGRRHHQRPPRQPQRGRRGPASGRTVLIEDGILRGYLQDDLNAR